MEKFLLAVSKFIAFHIDYHAGCVVKSWVYLLPSVKRRWHDKWCNLAINGEPIEPPKVLWFW